MTSPSLTESLIKTAVHKFTAPRSLKYISIPGVAPKHNHVHEDGVATLLLPNNQKVKVVTDASGRVTHVIEDEHQHAIARPLTYRRGR